MPLLLNMLLASMILVQEPCFLRVALLNICYGCALQSILTRKRWTTPVKKIIFKIGKILFVVGKGCGCWNVCIYV